MTKVFGLIGRIASGKTVVADVIVKERSAGYYRFSDVLKDILCRLHRPDTRENLQCLGVGLRKCFGDSILADTLKEDVLKDKRKYVVVDGIRYKEEVDLVRELGGVIIYVTSPQTVRYERVISRATRGEKAISFEEFKKSEEKETERMIDELGRKADIIIENIGSLEELKEKTAKLLSDY